MSLSTVTNGNTAQANDLNQIVNVLQQPSGGQEKGRYHIQSSAYANNAHVSCYVCSLSRNATPVSVSIDTSGGLANMGGAGTTDLTSSGFLVDGTGVGPNLDIEASGNYTLQF